MTTGTAPVLIVGAGYSGSRLATQLRADGQAVLTVSRSPRDGADHQIWQADADAALVLPPGPFRVVYLVPPAAGRPEPRLAALLAALTEPPERVVLASTSGVYGNCDGALIDESQPTNPGTERARRRVHQEQTLADWAGQRAVRTLTLRIAGIYGPGRLPIERIQAGEPVIAAADAYPGNRIHVDDLVRIMAAAVEHPSAAGVFNVADGQHISGTDYYRRVAALAGIDAPQEISRAEAERTFSPQRYSFLAESRRLDVTRLRDELGVTLRYTDLDAGIRAALHDQG
ncbi:MAG: NAD-dependent epimerase/dehydratase family protein [Pseudomonadota bacterium]